MSLLTLAVYANEPSILEYVAKRIAPLNGTSNFAEGMRGGIYYLMNFIGLTALHCAIEIYSSIEAIDVHSRYLKDSRRLNGKSRGGRGRGRGRMRGRGRGRGRGAMFGGRSVSSSSEDDDVNNNESHSDDDK